MNEKINLLKGLSQLSWIIRREKFSKKEKCIELIQELQTYIINNK